MPRGRSRRRSRSASPPRHRRRHRSRSRSRSHSPRQSESQNPRRIRGRTRSRRRRQPDMPKKKDRIPDNWADVAKMGTLVGSSRFVPLRVPLDAKYLPQFERMSEEIWAPSDFLEAQETQNLDVKMIVDLTNTFKYYNGYEEFQNSGVHYVKLRIEGFNGPPAAKDVAKFMEIVDEFVEKEPEGAIAVHCTHGLNRTGYLIVNYLVERLDYTVTQALEAFKAARPPGLIKHMYVEELYQRLGTEEEEVQLPELPDWASAKYGKRAKEGKRGSHGDRGRRDNREHRVSIEGGEHGEGEGEREEKGRRGHGGRRDRRGRRHNRDHRGSTDGGERGEGEREGRDRRDNHGRRDGYGERSRGSIDGGELRRGKGEGDETRGTHLRFEADCEKDEKHGTHMKFEAAVN